MAAVGERGGGLAEGRKKGRKHQSPTDSQLFCPACMFINLPCPWKAAYLGAEVSIAVPVSKGAISFGENTNMICQGEFELRANKGRVQIGSPDGFNALLSSG